MYSKSKPLNPPGSEHRAMVLIPATGEFVYSTTTKVYTSGDGERTTTMNKHGRKVNVVKSLEDLFVSCPNLESISLVVGWFGDDLRPGSCTVRPKVENNDGSVAGNDWVVNGVERQDALIPSNSGGGLAYGATPSDESVLDILRYLKARGIKVMFYPFILMDIPADNQLPDKWGNTGQSAYPWRGWIEPANVDKPYVGSTAELAHLFGKCEASQFRPLGNTVNYTGPSSEWGIRRFILHYARLCSMVGVEAFCIGSEMVGINRMRSSREVFPAIPHWVKLARDVKNIIPNTLVSYAADWSEFISFQPQDGTGDVFFPLDELWGDRAIDFIGVDNYLPLSDWRDGVLHEDYKKAGGSIYNLDYLMGNIEGGEGFDYYYGWEKRESGERYGLNYWPYRTKDHRGWWENTHHNRVNGAWQIHSTKWVPQSKQIWYTEIGCAHIDKGTNQPNVFIDPKSANSAAPYFSNGQRDDLIAQRYYEAMYKYWEPQRGNNPISKVTGKPMINNRRMYAWCWDARPYPLFPDREDVWSDGPNYDRGHFLNGRPHMHW